MKQITQPKLIDLPPTELHLEDIDELFEVIRGVAKEVRIEVPGYELESSEELGALAKKLSTKVLHEFKISAYQPSLSLNFNPQSTRLFIGDQTLELLGVQTKIVEFMSRRRQTFWWAMNPWVVPTMGPIAIYAGAQFNKWVLGATAVITVAIYWWFFRRSFRSYSIAHLNGRDEHESFWVRNRDKIILAVLSALLGAIGKGLYEYIKT